jgi:peptide/nickel transport system ATP-binding protein
MEAVAEVRNLKLAYREHDRWLRVLHGVDFTIGRGEVFGLVGESGCGKSTVGLQLLGYAHANLRVEEGEVLFRGRNLIGLARPDLDRLRGNRIGFVPQNPTTALYPSIRVGAQITEVFHLHRRDMSEADVLRRTEALFDLVGLPDPHKLRGRYPHELSGGQQQRVCIAMAIACDPDLIVLDEPTTGLDVTTQEQIISLLVDLRTRLGTSMFYVTHDLGLLAQIADRVGVMYAGHLVESGPSRAVFNAPVHPYTMGLIASVPRIDDAARERRPALLKGALRRSELPPGCPFAPRCGFAEPSCAENRQVLEGVAPGHDVACQRWRTVEKAAPRLLSEGGGDVAARVSEVPILACRSLTVAYGAARGPLRRFSRASPFVAVDGLDLAIGKGETVALVGESGSGKSTAARAISGLLSPHSGDIRFEGRSLAPSYKERGGEERRQIQFIFQNPDASLNPRQPVREILARPLHIFYRLGRGETERRIESALDDVRLERSYLARYPDQLSGGERQRVAIARALLAEPELLLCDEILSALDVSVQATVIELLRQLRSEHGISMLFISHDLSVVRSLADRVGVLFRGQLMQIGSNESTFAPPYHPYTHALIRAVPTVAAVKTRAARQPPAEPVRGAACAFAGRCPWQVGPICVDTPPPWRQSETGAAIRCHIPLPELVARGADIAIPNVSEPSPNERAYQ